MADLVVPVNVRQVGATRDGVVVAWDRQDFANTIKYEYRLNGGVPVDVSYFSFISIGGFGAGETKTLEVRAYRADTITEPIDPFFPNVEVTDWSAPIQIRSEVARQILWTNVTDRRFEAGLDRGVLYPKNAPAVPWVGLISVDQGGTEESRIYYQDGRPYLHVPIPKEYLGTLSAYTYPDEFSPMMGVPQVAGGLYLDSQNSEQFDLSYRTLVGDSTVGVERGYKIHLIYNATVEDQGVSYESLSNEINPSSFSWQIKAVPVPIPGYRATAHVTIDTQSLSAEKIKMLEDILYGGNESFARLPEPAELLGLMGLSGTITITDNGDQTWKAEGPYQNVQDLGGGQFRITNIDSIDLGDGTYTITTTTV